MSSDNSASCSPPVANRDLDARGLRCPMPLLKAKQALRDMAAGEVLKVTATDAGSWRDFQAWAQLSGHALLAATQEEGVYCYWLQKAASQDSGQ